MNLIYNIDDKYSNVAHQIIVGEELTDEQLEMLRAIDDSPENKAKNDAAIIKNLEAESEAIEKAITHMEKRLFLNSGKIERLKHDLKQYLIDNGLTKVSTPYFNVCLKQNPPSTLITDVEKIPQSYVKETIVSSLDKKAILADLKNGVDVPGASIVQNIRLEIK